MFKSFNLQWAMNHLILIQYEIVLYSQKRPPIPSTAKHLPEDTWFVRMSKVWDKVSQCLKVKCVDIPLKTLDILPANFIVENVRHLVAGNLLPRGTFVNTDYH